MVGDATWVKRYAGIRTVGRWDARHDQRWGLDWHRNEGIELTLLSRGRLAFATDAGEQVLRPGDLTVTRPWQRHRVGAPFVTPGRLHWLILALADCSSAAHRRSTRR